MKITKEKTVTTQNSWPSYGTSQVEFQFPEWISVGAVLMKSGAGETSGLERTGRKQA